MAAAGHQDSMLMARNARSIGYAKGLASPGGLPMASHLLDDNINLTMQHGCWRCAHVSVDMLSSCCNLRVCAVYQQACGCCCCCRRIVAAMHEAAPALRGPEPAAIEAAGRAVSRCLTLALEAIGFKEVRWCPITHVCLSYPLPCGNAAAPAICGQPGGLLGPG